MKSQSAQLTDRIYFIIGTNQRHLPALGLTPPSLHTTLQAGLFPVTFYPRILTSFCNFESAEINRDFPSKKILHKLNMRVLFDGKFPRVEFDYISG